MQECEGKMKGITADSKGHESCCPLRNEIEEQTLLPVQFNTGRTCQNKIREHLRHVGKREANRFKHTKVLFCFVFFYRTDTEEVSMKWRTDRTDALVLRLICFACSFRALKRSII